MKEASELLSAISSFAWPVIAAVILWSLRGRLSEFLSVAISRIEKSSEIEFGSLKIKGAIITQSGDVLRDGGQGFEIVEATAKDVSDRHAMYRRQHNLMIVHTVKPKIPEEQVDGQRVFDVSVFLHSHRGFGRLNDVESVVYFFGDKWGRGKYGSKFIVKSANDQFALTAQMYGSALCVADIAFHDGTNVQLTRYLDVEMAPVYGVPLKDARG